MSQSGPHGVPAPSADAWRLPAQEPTNLLAPWPDDRPPTRTDVTAALASAFDAPVEIVDDVPPEAPDLLWCVAVRVPTLREPVVFWAEPARPMTDEDRRVIGAGPCSWVVGAETLLDARDPVGGYVALVRAMCIALPDTPAILDVNTTRWHARSTIDETFAPDTIGPPEDVLWVIHAVESAAPDTADAPGIWLHTHGLWRCGAPELEMLEVPAEFASSAAELINDVAALLLEHEAPAPGERFEVGTGLNVVFQPWQSIVPCVDEGAPGGAADRIDDGANAHVGVRAVICAEAPDRNDRPAWTWPREVMERLMRDEAGVFQTRRATERQACLARAAWDDLAVAFAKVARLPRTEDDRPLVLFGVKAGFAVAAPEDSGREHLWFEVQQFESERIEGVLVNQPIAIADLTRGDRIWVDRDRVSDFRVMTPQRSFGPNEMAAVWRVVDELAAREGAS